MTRTRALRRVAALLLAAALLLSCVVMAEGALAENEKNNADAAMTEDIAGAVAGSEGNGADGAMTDGAEDANGAESAPADGEAGAFAENEWNYVDGAMDVSGGIPEDAEGALWKIRQAGVLRVATEPYFPPQEFIDPDKSGQDSYVGADMELARRIAERMGVELVIVPMSFAQVLDAVADGSCDLAVSALSYTPGRAAQVTLSKGYFFAGESAGSGLLIRAEDAGRIRGVEDLKGCDIVAQAGSIQEMLMAENAPKYREFRRLAQIRDVYGAVESGEADAAMAEVVNAESYIENNPDCGLMLVPGARFAPEAVYDGDRVAAKKGEYQLIYFVNGVIDEVAASGEYRAWYEKYEALAVRLGMY